MSKLLSLTSLTPLLVIGGIVLATLPAASPATTPAVAPAATQPPATAGAGAPAVPPPAPQPTFVDTAELAVKLSPVSEDDSALAGKATVFLRNEGEELKSLQITALVRDDAGANYTQEVEIKPGGDGESFLGKDTFKQGETRAIQLNFHLPAKSTVAQEFRKNSSLALSGYLLTGSGAQTQRRPLKITASGQSSYAGRVVLPAILLAALVVTLSYALTKDRKPLREQMELPESPSGSLVTNLAAFSSALTAIFTSLYLPASTRYMTKSEYNSLAALFVLLVACAPIVYRAILTPAKSSPPGSGKFTGYVGLFLLSSMITLWAAFAQAPTVWLLLDEFRLAQYVSPTTAWIFKILLLVVGVFLVAHAFLTIRRSVRKELPKADDANVPFGLPATAEPRPSASNWSWL